MYKRFAFILLGLGAAFAVGLWSASIGAAEAPAGRRCQWTYLVDHGQPEIAGFPSHEPLADTQTGRGIVKSNDAELRKRWEHLGQTGWQLKTATHPGGGVPGAAGVVYVFEHCQ